MRYVAERQQSRFDDWDENARGRGGGAVRDPLHPVSRRQGECGAAAPGFRRRPRRTRQALSGDGAGAQLRRQGGGAAAHRAARHLRVGPRPGGGGGRPRRGDAARGRAGAELSRAWRAIVARRHDDRALPVLGRRRARQRFRRGARRFPDLRAGRNPCAARCRCRDGVQTASTKSGSRSARSATAPPRRATSPRR